jgi:hypothetical protein
MRDGQHRCESRSFDVLLIDDHHIFIIVDFFDRGDFDGFLGHVRRRGDDRRDGDAALGVLLAFCSFRVLLLLFLGLVERFLDAITDACLALLQEFSDLLLRLEFFLSKPLINSLDERSNGSRKKKSARVGLPAWNLA